MKGREQWSSFLGSDSNGNGKYRFPWREGNRFRLLVDGHRFFPAMLESIAAARHFILMEMYLFESGRVADSFIRNLCDAAHRGVRVCLFLDHFGTFSLRQRDLQKLLKAQVEVAFFNPVRFHRWFRNLSRNHRKLLLIDGEVAYTGGAGIADAFTPEASADHFWHDLMLEVRGPCISDWHRIFVESWQKYSGRPLDLAPLPPKESSSGKSTGRVNLHNRLRSRSEIMRSFINRTRTARRRVWFATPYFVPSWKMRRTLRRAVRSGIDVRILLPGPRTDNPAVRLFGRRYYGKLLRSGIRIFEYQPRFLHAKILMADDWVSIGSSNLDHWDQRWNLEANQEVLNDTNLLRSVEELFTTDFQKSREISYQEWLRRPWSHRFMERILSWVFTLSTRIRDQRFRKP